MEQFKPNAFNKLIENINTDSLEKLVDSWQYRGKLRYSEHANIISLEDWWNLEINFDHLTRLYVNCESEEKFVEFLKNNINVNHVDCLAKLYNVRKNDLTEYLSYKSNNFTNTLMKDFDWSLKYSASSDKLSKLNHPNLTLTLTTLDLNDFQNRCNDLVGDDDKNDANRSSKINFELNKQELDEFISTLEVIQTKMEIYD